MKVGGVVEGRNEGERLKRCIKPMPGLTEIFEPRIFDRSDLGESA